MFNTTPSAGTSTFSGFGANSAGTTSGGMFGAPNKPAFGGTQGSSGGSLFGGGTGFGSQPNQPTSAFGAPISSALGPNSAECQGTGSTPFQATTEKEGTTSGINHFQSISFMQPYKNFSFEVSQWRGSKSSANANMFQELRFADYNQGRRFGNASGQAGAFGASSGFGGFGTQQNPTGPFGAPQAGGSLFGAQSTSAASPFGGGTQTASSGFGGSGLFGQKQATTSLFGGAPASTSQTGGGLFDTSGQSGFGATQNTGTGFGTGGGLFGASSQQQQKPASGFSFGGTNPGSGFGGGATGTGFGTGSTPNNTGGGLFGTNQTTSAFGGGQQQQPSTSNPFSTFGSNQQNQNQTSTGSAFGGFGGQQQKPGGLFGTTNSTTNNPAVGLFGTNTQNNQQQQQPTGGLFGTNNQPASTSLFGTSKPAATGTSLFGNSPNTTSNNTSNLFGGFGGNNANQSQPNAGGGLFGGTNQSQQKPGGLFSNTGSTTGGGLFGGNTNNNAQQPAGGSIFGNLGSNNQQQQSTSLFGNTNNASSGLFNNSQQQQNALQPPQAMTASLTDRYPYGSASIFDGLPPPPQANPGPLATPISTGNKMRKSAILPQYKINPHTASRLVTPQKRGYGFSYSTYGTPSSVSSNVSTPGGLGSSLLYGSIGRGLGKSLSTSNLRRTFDSDRESILSPGAFSAGSSRSSGSKSGSLKKLTIDRSLRTDLFGDQGIGALPSTEKNDQSRQPGILKKKVSFDASTVGGNGTNQDTEINDINGSATSNLQSSATPSAQEQGFLRSSSRTNGKFNGSRSNGTPSQSEMEQVKGNELAIVHEDGSPEAPNPSSLRPPPQIPQADPEPGAYYMRPSRDELSKMPKHQLKSMKGFCVGREGCGRVMFDEPVDLTTVDLDKIFGKIAVIETRSLTVYPETDQKPPLGKGLNVPSTIYLENSWPRQKDRKTPSHEKSGPRFQKHVDRLRKVTGTEFVRYEKDMGTWVFKVPHFTTYALDFDDTGSEGESLHTSGLSEPPDTPTPKNRTPRDDYTPASNASAQGSSFLSQSVISSSPDDTFEFRKKKVLPGAFDDTVAFEEDHEMEEVTYRDQSFLGERLAASSSDSGEDEPSDIHNPADDVHDRSLIVHDEDLEMAGSFPQPGDEDTDPFNAPGIPTSKSLLKSSQQNHGGFDTPGKLVFHGSDEWAQQLQRTISPRKQDRQALRQSQAHVMKDRELIYEDTPKAHSATNGPGQLLATSIDLMHSLFGQEQARRSGRGKQANNGKGFEV